VNGAVDDRLRSPGYTPKAREVPALFELLAAADDDDVKYVERALSRLGVSAADAARERFVAARAPLRGRLTALIGRVARGVEEEAAGALTDWLAERLDDADPKTRRRAGTALGKIGGARVEAALVAAIDRATELPDLRAFATALGKVGGEAGRARLSALGTDDPELLRIVREATMKVDRGLARREPSSVDLTVAPLSPLSVLLHVRAGLEELLLDELGEKYGARRSGRGRVAVVLEQPVAVLYAARTFLDLGFPLEPVRVEDDDVADAVVRALTTPQASQILSRFTRGNVRYRLSWAAGGRRRALNFRIAAAVAERRPELANDPTAAPWEVVVTERIGKASGQIFVELWPCGAIDPRFAYRRHATVASSHPTIAAALARAGGVLPDDVVWDPFAGSATELIERARLGPYARLHATDVDATALDRARDNLEAAGVDRYTLTVGDARSARVHSPSLVITNPPFGRRIRTDGPVGALLADMLANAARQLRPGGRVVMMSPEPRTTERAAAQAGLIRKLGTAVDVGGIPAELQVFVKGEAR
jgi:23S rRNA G2445 N2-methylase RlmL